MKTFFKYIPLILSIFGLACCSSDVNVRDYIDKNVPLDLAILDSTSNPVNRHRTQIQINSDKYIQLLAWADKNTDEWQSTLASYTQADIIVSQGSFRLLYWIDRSGAVITFTSKDNKSRQYSKSLKKGELNFLINDLGKK